jgi:hypothetical protein
MAIGIAYVDGPRLARSVFAAADWVSAGREEINRLNVFPVPDGDTGTNFSLTLRSVADFNREDAGPATANQAVRLIRYGKEQSIIAGSSQTLGHAENFDADNTQTQAAPETLQVLPQ